MNTVGQIVSGEYGKLLVRQKSNETIELGELLKVVDGEKTLILQVYGLEYGTQLENKSIELMSGIDIEGYGFGEFMEEGLRTYVLAKVKALVEIEKNVVKIPKVLPKFFSKIERIGKKDLEFLEKPSNPVFLGNLRSGSKVLDANVYLDGKNMFSHHILIPATTGRGKSNLVKVILWNIIGEQDYGLLVLDSHDEYYGRNGLGLKDHKNANEGLVYYSSNPPKGGIMLLLNLKLLKPWHFRGIVNLTDAQSEAIRTYYQRYKDNWIEKLIKTDEPFDINIQPITIATLKRRLGLILGVYEEEGELISRGRTFVKEGGELTINDIVNALENGKKVIIDTSRLTDQAELLIGSMVANEIFEKHREAKGTEKFDRLPVVSIVIEEAPRVLRNEDNIFSTIAREGRKFKVGLTAITQLSSIIPKEVLANMNTKIIMGNEMALEREAIISSSAQDLTTDSKMIASLDKGEAIVSSVFTKFAIPIYVPLFEDIAKTEKKEKARLRFIQ
ncbi:MAG: ATP-binding protein [Candidatus Thermoplasmatota archaeon]